MKAITVLVTLMIGFAVGVSWARDDTTLARALTMLKAGEKQKAHALLEGSYRRARDGQEKARIALMLAFSEGARLKRTRWHYADYALKNYRNLDSTMAVRLTRIVGDGRFERGDFEGAKRSYQFVLSAPNSTLAEREYATFRLGWVYLNERSPERAFRLWQNWLAQEIQGDLRGPMVANLGRAWSESVLSGQQPNLRARLKNEAEIDLWVKSAGLIFAKHKNITQATSQRVLRALVGMPYRDRVLREMGERGAAALLAEPCENAMALDRLGADLRLDLVLAKSLVRNCRAELREQRQVDRLQVQGALERLESRNTRKRL